MFSPLLAGQQPRSATSSLRQSQASMPSHASQLPCTANPECLSSQFAMNEAKTKPIRVPSPATTAGLR